MKPAILAGRLSPLLHALQCPRCGGAFALTEQSLICENGHCYDLSRRGYVNLAPDHRQSGDKYDETLFESRGRVFAGGFYAPVEAGRLCVGFHAVSRRRAQAADAMDLDITRGVLETLMPQVRLKQDGDGVYGIECSMPV